GVDARASRDFRGAPRPGRVMTADETATAIGGGGGGLLDARSPERFRGENETLDTVAGHIPGAANHFFKWNLTDAGTFRSRDEIRERLRRSIGDVSPDRVICYCGSGVTACQNLLAFEHAGLGVARLFPGSW